MSRSPTDTTRPRQVVEALLHDLGPRLRRGGMPDEPLSRFPTGIPDLDRLIAGGFPRGRISEVTGPRSSGRTSLALALLARATRIGEVVAVIDGADAFDPASAQAAGVLLEQVLWVRQAPVFAGARTSLADGSLRAPQSGACAGGFGRMIGSGQPANLGASLAGARTSLASGSLRAPQSGDSTAGARTSLASGSLRAPQSGACELALKSTERVLAGRGFGLLVLDLAEVGQPLSAAAAARLTRAAAGSGTALVMLGTRRLAGTSADLALELRPLGARFTGTPALLEALQIEISLARHRTAPAALTITVCLRASRAA